MSVLMAPNALTLAGPSDAPRSGWTVAYKQVIRTLYKQVMRTLYTEITIHATPSKIWSILTAFDRYPEWNPFIKSIQGTVIVGKTFRVILQSPNAKPMTFSPKCLRLDIDREFRWLGHLFLPGLFDGEHIFELVDKSDRTKFVQRELFKGILVPLLWKQLNTKTRKGFELMNQELKELAEKL